MYSGRSHAQTTAPASVEMPLELREKHPGLCRKLRIAIYGGRGARGYGGKLQSWGFRHSLGSPCFFWHPGRDIYLAAHRDDFAALGPECEIQWFHDQIAAQYEVKVRGILGRIRGIIRKSQSSTEWWHRKIWGIRYEADPKRAEQVIQYMREEKCKWRHHPRGQREAGGRR